MFLVRTAVPGSQNPQNAPETTPKPHDSGPGRVLNRVVSVWFREHSAGFGSPERPYAPKTQGSPLRFRIPMDFYVTVVTAAL